MAFPCNLCGAECSKYRCGRCFYVTYCSPECQKKDWDTHYESCHYLPKNTLSHSGVTDALELGLFATFQKLTCKQKNWDNTDYGQHMLYEAVIGLILESTLEVKHQQRIQSLIDQIQKSKRYLEFADKIELFNCIPPCYHLFVLSAWNF